MTNPTNGYVCFYKGKRLEVYADTLLQARNKAQEVFKAKHGYEINIMLAELKGEQYVH